MYNNNNHTQGTSIFIVELFIARGYISHLVSVVFTMIQLGLLVWLGCRS